MINIFCHSVFKSSLRFPTICCNMGMERNRLMQDGTAEPVLRDEILRRGRGQGQILILPVQLRPRAGFKEKSGDRIRLINTLAICVPI